MTLPQKLEILIRRTGISKTDIAEMTGITYRALANYISGGRNPRAAILSKLAENLNTTSEFLLDETRGLVLTSEERFAFNAKSPEPVINSSLSLLSEVRGLFANAELTKADKRAFFSCLSELYFDGKD